MAQALRGYQQRIQYSVGQFIADPKAGQRGQVYAPTGAGKTVCFAATIASEISLIERFNLPKKLRICIAYPRIALVQDQLRRLKGEFGSAVHFTSFHSGAHVNSEGDEAMIGEKSTLDARELANIIEATDRHHITVVSYKSLPKLVDFPFDILICDEAHNLVTRYEEDDMREDAAKLTMLRALAALKIVFYTATPIFIHGGDTGMDSAVLFGRQLEAVEPAELIAGGYIVPPFVHYMTINTDHKGVADTIDAIANAWTYQSTEMSNRGMPYHQMLVACRGTSDIVYLNERLADLWKMVGRQIDVYTVLANQTLKNGTLVMNRFMALAEIKASGKDAIIVHYDTLSEGIDIDSLTGVLLMRDMLQHKIIQTIGRTARPFRDDVVNGEMLPIAARRKQYGMVTLAIFDGDKEAARISAIADAFVEGGYGDLTTFLNTAVVNQALGSENVDDDFTNPAEFAYALTQSISHQRQADRLVKLGIKFF